MTPAAGRLTAPPLADRYRLERELGADGIATVFLAEDLKHRREVKGRGRRVEDGSSPLDPQASTHPLGYFSFATSSPSRRLTVATVGCSAGSAFLH